MKVSTIKKLLVIVAAFGLFSCIADMPKVRAQAIISGVAAQGFDVTSTAPTLIKASGGAVVGWYGYNPNASVCFLQFYNSSSTSGVTVGTNALHPFGVPATNSFNLSPGSIGMFSLSSGIVVAQATAATGSTTQCGSPMIVTVEYE